MSDQGFVFECNFTEPPFKSRPMFMRVWLCSKTAGHGSFDFTLLSEKLDVCEECEAKFLWEKEFPKGLPDLSRDQLMTLLSTVAQAMNSVSELFAVAGEQKALEVFKMFTEKFDTVMSAHVESQRIH